MKVLVTGGSGFIGSHLVEKLVERGIKVRIYDLIYPDFLEDTSNVEYYQGSLLEYDRLRLAMGTTDYVFHLAAVAYVKDVYEEPKYAEAINVRGTFNVLEAARTLGRIKRVIYASTIWVYSDTEGNLLDENSPLSPPSHLYTATKIMGEYYCKSYYELYKVPYTILRFGIPYGPRARQEGVVPTFIRKALNGEPLTIAGDGMQYRKFVYVEDLAEGCVLALKKIAKNKVYNLEGDEKITIKQIAETIQKILGKVEINYIEGRPGDFCGKEISNELAKKELGWYPKTSFDEGIRKYIDWYRHKLEMEKAEEQRIEKILSKI